MRVWIEEGPGGKTGALQKIQRAGESVASIVADDTDVRCRRCGRVLHSEKAIRAGVGWRCRARLTANGGAAGE